MTDVKLGKLLEVSQPRDAIHVAVMSLVAGEALSRGEPFRLKWGTTDVALKGTYNVGLPQDRPDVAMGIIDPFLDRYVVNKGQRCWGLLYPNTVTGMRHEWQHPRLAAVPKVTNTHEKWLRRFAERWNFDFDELIAAGTGVPPADWPGPELIAEGAEAGEDIADYTWERFVVARGRDLHTHQRRKEGLSAKTEAAFWMHLEAYTQQTFDAAHREHLEWSCTC